MNRLRSESGQAVVLSVLFLSALMGAMALVLDVGSWFREQRAAQAAADAAALAGAQGLPVDTGRASALASQYLAHNGGGTGVFDFNAAGDTITVEVTRPAEGVFTKLFGIESVEVHARAAARAGGLEAAQWVAPIVVNVKHPELNCDVAHGRPVPCFGKPTEIELEHLHKPGSGTAAGSFSLINLQQGDSGSAGASTLGEWIVNGFSGYMELGNYNVVPSAMFNDSHVKGAMSTRMANDPVLMFPIYDKIVGSGSTAEYHVIGWVAFHVTSYNANGASGAIRGYFEKVIWEGIQSQNGGNLNYGTTTIELVE